MKCISPRFNDLIFKKKSMKSKQKFIQFLLATNSLQFVEFTLKSGRVSPYFFNLGRLNGGDTLMELGEFYADCIVEKWGGEFDIVFGPAYKGIPLAVATVFALYKNHNLIRRYSANRKEVKTHGDASAFLGAEIKSKDRIILVDDVMTTGATKYEAVKLLRSLGDVKIQGLVIGLNRLERGENGKDAVAEFTRETGVPVWSIITARDVAGYIKHGSAEQTALLRYLNEYGISG